MNNSYAFQNELKGEDIKNLRISLGLTQSDFSCFLGVSKKTIERWESGKEPVKGPVTRLARLLWEDDLTPDRYRIPEQTYPLRIFYYYKDILCTIIDVDDMNQHIGIRNFTGKYSFRAFGSNDRPTYEDYRDFLESRCFPPTRDKMKLILKDLNLPFYDPLMIVEKTGGRMAEDYFRLEIVRL